MTLKISLIQRSKSASAKIVSTKPYANISYVLKSNWRSWVQRSRSEKTFSVIGFFELLCKFGKMQFKSSKVMATPRPNTVELYLVYIILYIFKINETTPFVMRVLSVW